MAQIKKKFIQDSAVDGAKILLLNNQALRAKLANGTSEDVMKVDASGVLQILKLPQISVDPVLVEDVARKGYVDGRISSEAATRTKADSALQSAIDTEKARVDAILSASTADKDSFAEIVSLINSVDATNDSAFAGYVTSNNAALAQEVKDREAGDNALDGRLDIVEGADTVVGSIAKALKDAKAYTDSVSSGVSGTLSSDLAQEIKDRAAGDVALDGRLDIIEGSGAGSIAKAQTDAQSFATSAVAAEAALRASAVSAEATARASAVSTEASARIAADALKQDIITVSSPLVKVGVDLSMPESSISANGYLSSANFTAFEKRALNMQSGLMGASYVQSSTSKFRTYYTVTPSVAGNLNLAATDVAYAGIGWYFRNAGSAVATFVPASGQLINGLATLDLLPGEMLGVISTGSGWVTIGNLYGARIDVLTAADATEAAARTKADVVLQANIDTEKARVDAILSASSADKDSFAEIVSLINSVDATNDSAFAGYVTSNNAALAQEVKDRAAADTSLSGRLGTIEGSGAGSVAKAQADAQAFATSAVSAEAALRTTADGLLNGRLVVLEADPTTKTYVDGKIATVNGDLDDANGAITDLQSDVTALEAKVFNKETKTLSAQNNTDGYIDLAFTVEANSLFVHTNSLFLGEGEDYSLSVVAGKTRVTWLNEFASAGVNAFESGEKVFIQYRK